MKDHVQNQMPSTIYLLHQAGQALRSRLESEFKDLNITGLQFTILGLLARHDGLSSAELARRFFVTPQTMNQVVATMMRRGLLERSVSEDNRRILRMRLSPAGSIALRDGSVIARQVEKDAMSWIAPEQHAPLRDMLATLLRNLRSEPPPEPLLDPQSRLNTETAATGKNRPRRRTNA